MAVASGRLSASALRLVAPLPALPPEGLSWPLDRRNRNASSEPCGALKQRKRGGAKRLADGDCLYLTAPPPEWLCTGAAKQRLQRLQAHGRLCEVPPAAGSARPPCEVRRPTWADGASLASASAARIALVLHWLAYERLRSLWCFTG